MKKWALMYDLVYHKKNKWDGYEGNPVLRDHPKELLTAIEDLKNKPKYIENIRIVEMTFHDETFFDLHPELLI